MVARVKFAAYAIADIATLAMMPGGVPAAVAATCGLIKTWSKA
jgi:hypothetical protein